MNSNRGGFDWLSSPGGRLIVSFVTMMVGLIAYALGVELGRDIATGSFGALLVLLHQPVNREF